MTEDEMVRQHHQLNGHEFEQIPGHREGQGSMACCSHGAEQQQKYKKWNNSVVRLSDHYLNQIYS